MIRLTVTLIVAIYIILIVVPDADHADSVDVTRETGQNWLIGLITAAEEGAQRPPRDRAIASAEALRSSVTDGLIETEAGFALETAQGEQLEISAIINPVDLMHEAAATDVAVARVSTAIVAEPVAGQAPSGEIWRVTASAVNFRDGPSTNTRVLTSLRRGEEVEFLASANDAWARLRVVSSGLEGYMAAEFLERVN
jgi:hypothetical protein